jgi:hypothetical protein
MIASVGDEQMGNIVTEGSRENQEFALGAGLIKIRDCVQNHRIILDNIASFRTNHIYDRLEQSRRLPAIHSNVIRTDGNNNINSLKKHSPIAELKKQRKQNNERYSDFTLPMNNSD